MEAAGCTVHGAALCGEDENRTAVAAYYKPLYQVSWADDFDEELVSRLEERSRREQENLVEIHENPSCSNVVEASDLRPAAVAEVIVQDDDAEKEEDSTALLEEQEATPPVVEGEPAEPVAGQAVDDCPCGSHRFSPLTARDDNYYCADCRVHIPKGEEVIGCEFCPKDLCTDCHATAKRVPYQPRPAQPPMPPPPDMGTGGHAIEPIAAKAVHVRPPTTYGHKKAKRSSRKRQEATPQPVLSHSSSSSSNSSSVGPINDIDQNQNRVTSVSSMPSYYSHTPYNVRPLNLPTETHDNYEFCDPYDRACHQHVPTYEPLPPPHFSTYHEQHHNDSYYPPHPHHDTYPSHHLNYSPLSPQDYYCYN